MHPLCLAPFIHQRAREIDPHLAAAVCSKLKSVANTTIQPFTADGHLSCFHFLTIRKKAKDSFFLPLSLKEVIYLLRKPSFKNDWNKGISSECACVFSLSLSPHNKDMRVLWWAHVHTSVGQPLELNHWMMTTHCSLSQYHQAVRRNCTNWHSHQQHGPLHPHLYLVFLTFSF